MDMVLVRVFLLVGPTPWLPVGILSGKLVLPVFGLLTTSLYVKLVVILMVVNISGISFHIRLP